MYFIDKNPQNIRFELIHLKSIRYWHRPGGGLTEVLEKMKEEGIKNPALLNKDYVELYIGSLFTMALQESEQSSWWIAKPIEDPPDIAIMTMELDAKQRTWFSSRELEITRYIPKKKSLIETILDKDKPYPGNYVIVCFLETNSIEYLKKISDQLIRKLKNIHHVFLIFHGMAFSELKKLPQEEAMRKVTLAQVSPIFKTQIIDIIEGLEKWRLDNKKLVYTENRKVYYGLRSRELVIPKIVS